MWTSGSMHEQKSTPSGHTIPPGSTSSSFYNADMWNNNNSEVWGMTFVFGALEQIFCCNTTVNQYKQTSSDLRVTSPGIRINKRLLVWELPSLVYWSNKRLLAWELPPLVYWINISTCPLVWELPPLVYWINKRLLVWELPIPWCTESTNVFWFEIYLPLYTAAREHLGVWALPWYTKSA